MNYITIPSAADELPEGGNQREGPGGCHLVFVDRGRAEREVVGARKFAAIHPNVRAETSRINLGASDGEAGAASERA